MLLNGELLTGVCIWRLVIIPDCRLSLLFTFNLKCSLYLRRTVDGKPKVWGVSPASGTRAVQMSGVKNKFLNSAFQFNSNTVCTVYLIKLIQP